MSLHIGESSKSLGADRFHIRQFCTRFGPSHSSTFRSTSRTFRFGAHVMTDWLGAQDTPSTKSTTGIGNEVLVEPLEPNSRQIRGPHVPHRRTQPKGHVHKGQSGSQKSCRQDATQPGLKLPKITDLRFLFSFCPQKEQHQNEV